MQTVALQTAVSICMIENVYHRLNNIRLYTSDNCLVQHFARLASDHPQFLGEPMDHHRLVLKHAISMQQKEAKHKLELCQQQWRLPGRSGRDATLQAHHRQFKQLANRCRNQGHQPH